MGSTSDLPLRKLSAKENTRNVETANRGNLNGMINYLVRMPGNTWNSHIIMVGNREQSMCCALVNKGGNKPVLLKIVNRNSTLGNADE